ncbi:SDR family oxidoreductase [Hymenobacter sp. RP-2-7]|uniref:SDR family oxidoreductase n=1 Tax=Hymenobacter polaris TaxID=2682546 RepID=A0A7Y0ACH6_9BACT|nr:SDR family oxidoreductase [Hymenobacter polaris]NML64810.1 SDR family oxidoreductase [Hymenobacter polaris]
MPTIPSQMALVTGATSGIGYELARLFAQDGINLALVARRQPELEAVKADFERQYGIRVSCLAADLSAPGQAAAVYRQCQEQGWQLDYLVNNAGFGSYKDVVQEDAALYEDMLTLNVLAVTTLTTLVARDMVRRRTGRILNVGSTSAFQPVPHMAVYGASKSYIMNFTEALHAELRGTGVTATVLSPGVTATNFLARADMGGWSQAQGKLPTATAVAKAGYRAMQQGELNVVTGLKNKLLALGISLVPFRKLKLAMATRFMREGT